MGATVIDMNETRLCTLGQPKAFLEGTGQVDVQPVGGDEGRYGDIKVAPRDSRPRTRLSLVASRIHHPTAPTPARNPVGGPNTHFPPLRGPPNHRPARPTQQCLLQSPIESPILASRPALCAVLAGPGGRVAKGKALRSSRKGANASTTLRRWLARSRESPLSALSGGIDRPRRCIGAASRPLAMSVRDYTPRRSEAEPR